VLTLLNLHDEPKTRLPPPLTQKYKSFVGHYHRHRKHVHRVRLFLETLSTAFYTIETKYFIFGFFAFIWIFVDITILLADDAD
jgi:hypothetical protein